METVTVKATIFWAQLNRKNELSGKYQVDLGCLSDKAVEALENLGVDVHNKGDDRGNFVTCKSTNAIRAYDPDNNEYDLEDVSIGNGSKAIAVVGYYEWTFKNKKGRSANLKRLKVTELVEYENEAVDET
jgi:hypothetical protein